MGVRGHFCIVFANMKVLFIIKHLLFTEWKYLARSGSCWALKVSNWTSSPLKYVGIWPKCDVSGRFFSLFFLTLQAQSFKWCGLNCVVIRKLYHFVDKSAKMRVILIKFAIFWLLFTKALFSKNYAVIDFSYKNEDR